MELRHLRYAAKLAERLNFTRAAEALHVTQSTLSHQIRQLEDELGCRMFDRSGRKIVLTPAGEGLMPGILRALEEVDLLVQAARKSARREIDGEIRMLVGARGFIRRKLPQCLETLKEHGLLVQLLIEEVSSVHFAAEWNRSYDLALSDQEHDIPGTVFEPLYREELVLVVPKSHHLAGRRKIRMVELEGEPLALPSHKDPVRNVVDRCFAAAGVRPLIAVEMNLVDSLFEVVRTNPFAGFASLPASIEGLAFVAVEDPVPERVLGLFWTPGAEVSPAAAAFADIIRAAVGRKTNDPIAQAPCDRILARQ